MDNFLLVDGYPQQPGQDCRNGLVGVSIPSRTQINRMLDPNDGNVTIETLQRAAALVGRRVQVELA